MAVFVEDPAHYLIELGISIPAYMDTSREAILDFAHRSRVNFENFYFADLESKARFDVEPAASAGILTDPVSRVRFRPTAASPRLVHNGHPYFFASDSTQALFAALPDSFPVTKDRMVPAVKSR
jgi:YHS domain-containing protein